MQQSAGNRRSLEDEWNDALPRRSLLPLQNCLFMPREKYRGPQKLIRRLDFGIIFWLSAGSPHRLGIICRQSAFLSAPLTFFCFVL